ncbi:Flp pilus assembly protein TadB [Symbiobacterium terraclitae]|uniref:Flp pilus assembly protein TadB n=1 Tax=Symbiobacterium terraclitae TaxID=557451 RepID=A0ABS4JS79_9FIRM|nr:hypothetical protein [Symbiobacterium terraclitae]MBP2017746.1 Flp pilus assembly protein TadB [Symbiobacterium terraclitae]
MGYSDHDELARRRAARAGQETQKEELPRFTWTDTLAMIIAAYQVLLPVVLVMIGVLLAVYFLFRWAFH